MNMNKKWILATSFTLLGLGAFLAIQSVGGVKHDKVIAEDATYTTVLSSANPVISGQAYTDLGAQPWFKGDSASGVTWNNGSGKVAIAKHGYIQNLSPINGIKSVKVDMVSGSVTLYHFWSEPADLEQAEYEDVTFNSTGTHTYSGALPNRFRIIANEDSVINSITIKYSCAAGAEDEHTEVFDQGLENGYFDAGSIGTYARTAFITDDTCDEESSRSLKLTFAGTTNNYVSFSTQKNTNKKLTSANPDFSHSLVSFKAKFSEDILNQDISVCAIGSGWADSSYIKANRNEYLDNGWQSYSLDLSKYDFAGNTSGIRLNIRPEGIDSTNKTNAYVLLDDVQIEYTANRASNYGLESAIDSWENMNHDINFEKTSYSFDTNTKFGQNSKSSLALRPKNSGTAGPDMKCCTVFSFDSDELFQDFDLSKGKLSFNFKSFATTNPSKVYLGIFQGWGSGEIAYASYYGTYVRDGWYYVEIDLSTITVASSTAIRLSIGWEVTSADTEKARMWIDNLHYEENPVTETVSEGWENMKRDTGWEASNGAVNATKSYAITTSETSKSSLRLSWSAHVGSSNANFVCLSPESEHMEFDATSGTLEAKFMFSGPITNKNIRLVLVDSDWKGARYNIPLTPIGNGWFQLKVDMSTISNYLAFAADGEYDGLGIIRLGFGFNGLNASNVASTVIYLDDVFYTASTPTYADASTKSNGSIWQAYDNEQILQDTAPISGRGISSSNPLHFESLKNETESAQLMINVHGLHGIDAFNFRVPNLYSESGAKISSSNIEVLAAKYIQVTKDSAEEKHTGWPGAGWYPDALVPIDNLIAAGENSIPNADGYTKDHEQSIWVNVTVPKDIRAGTYTGTGVLTLDGTNYAIPMEVIVHKATLPDYRTNKNLYLTWFDQVEKAIGHDNYNRYTRDSYLNYFFDKGINAGAYREGDWGSEPESFAEFYGARVAGNDKITAYRSPFHDGDYGYDEIYDYFDALITKNIEMVEAGQDVDFFEKLITNHNDEPSTAAEWQETREFNTAFQTAINALKDRLNDYPDLKASFVDQINVVAFNQARNTNNYDALTTPCPTYDYLNDAEDREAYHENFNHVWWYGCIVPLLPYPTFHLDGNITGIRMLTYMQYNYDIQGSVYWNLTYMQRKDYSEVVDVDVWSDPLTWGKGAGEGRLCYPGIRYGIVGPISTQRLEEVAASFDDYEYFALIEDKLGSRAATVSQLSSIMHFSSFFTGTQLVINSSNASNFVTYRHNLLNYIDSLY